MKQKKKKVSKKKIALLVLGSIVGMVLVLIAAFFGYMWYVGYQDARDEKIIEKKFHTEIKKYPQITVKNFKLWEGDSMVTLALKGKGEVSFWYGVEGVPD